MAASNFQLRQEDIPLNTGDFIDALVLAMKEGTPENIIAFSKELAALCEYGSRKCEDDSFLEGSEFYFRWWYGLSFFKNNLLYKKNGEYSIPSTATLIRSTSKATSDYFFCPECDVPKTETVSSGHRAHGVFERITAPGPQKQPALLFMVQYALHGADDINTTGNKYLGQIRNPLADLINPGPRYLIKYSPGNTPAMLPLRNFPVLLEAIETCLNERHFLSAWEKVKGNIAKQKVSEAPELTMPPLPTPMELNKISQLIPPWSSWFHRAYPHGKTIEGLKFVLLLFKRKGIYLKRPEFAKLLGVNESSVSDARKVLKKENSGK